MVWSLCDHAAAGKAIGTPTPTSARPATPRSSHWRPAFGERSAKPALFIFVFIVNHCWFVVFIVITFPIYGCNLQRVARNNFEIGPALVARNHFAGFDFVGIDIQRVVTFRAYH
jgi:hypothetical protein